MRKCNYFCSIFNFIYIYFFQTATTIAFCLYFLSQSPDWQAKLYEEVKGVDPATHDLQVGR